ncbi:hypothetical protein EMCG_05319 [[Emmonsia] crescens]|uniref:Uncharacterized protein n=1 Tax=[Emmonsia] crescens TaxID=73230 RepID=A0A0G2HP56_9EURO|nr:hypothetical protein EMCG_05319 [Emmonsia crescens UAMH 3008]
MSQGKTAMISCGGAIALSLNPQYHMEIQCKWQGEIQGLGTVELKQQIADGSCTGTMLNGFRESLVLSDTRDL